MTFHADSYRSGKKRISMSLRQQDGGSLVEFAIIAPLLFVILFGIIEFGILIYDKAMLTNAAREGARVGSLFGGGGIQVIHNADGTTDTLVLRAGPDEIESKVREWCEAHLISFGPGSNLEIIQDPREASLSVTVIYPFRFLVFSNLMAFIGGSLEDSIQLSARSVMRLE